jgi:adenine-specific DNA methylase
MSERRLIEEWLPIAEIGIESLRERTPMTPFPAPNRLHVWWARRPLVASRAAVLASLLPADSDHGKFLRALGILGDPVKAKKRMALADRAGERLGADAYGYRRAFTHALSTQERAWITENSAEKVSVLDPTAGGGSIPFEADRLGFTAFANDLNPVAALILKATVEYPAQFGSSVVSEFAALGARFVPKVREALRGVFPEEGLDTRPDGYLFARTIHCPYCDGLIPMSPNWRLSSDGTGVRLLAEKGDGPLTAGRICRFEIVNKVGDHSEGTVSDGDATCPYPDCSRVVDGDEIKRQAQAGRMGEQLYTVVLKRKVVTGKTKTGIEKIKWVRGFRAPRHDDDNSSAVAQLLAKKLPEWEANDLVPGEAFPDNTNDDRPIQYGMPLWRDLFSPRQLLCHGTSVEMYRELLDTDRGAGLLTHVRKAAYVYLALALDKLLNYNSRMSVWMPTREVVANTFNRHDFAFCASHSEMAPLVLGLGYDWAVDATEKCLEELVALVRPEEALSANIAAKAQKRSAKGADLFSVQQIPSQEPASARPSVTITCQSGDHLDVEAQEVVPIQA